MAGDRYRLVSFPEGFFFEKGERKLGCAIIDLQHGSGIFFREETWERFEREDVQYLCGIF